MPTVTTRIAQTFKKPNIAESYGTFASLQAAMTYVENADIKCAGLTVGINQEDGSVKEYWLQPVEGQLQFVEKGGGDTSNLATKQELQQGLSGKQDTIQDLQQIRTRANEGHTALQPVSGAQENNFASFDANGGIKDSTYKAADFATASQGAKADTAVQQVTVGTTITGAAGSNASVTNSGTSTAPVLDFAIPRGADGADAVNPYKGYFNSLSDLQSKYPTGETGDFANVYDLTADKTYRYVWDASLATPAWVQALDSSSQPIEVTPSTATFATGEELINVGIDNSFAGGSDKVAGAIEVKEIGDEVFGYSESDWEEKTLTPNSYYNTNYNGDGIINMSSMPYSAAYSVKLYVNEGDVFKITGVGGSQYAYLFATCASEENNTVLRHATETQNVRNNPLELTIQAGEGVLVVNLVGYDATTDKVEVSTTQSVQGLVEKVAEVEGKSNTINANVSYLECTQSASDEVKLISNDDYILSTHARLLVKMTKSNTHATPKLNVNSTGAKAIWYNGAIASDTNTWDDGEVLDIYYDGEKYIAMSNKSFSLNDIEIILPDKIYAVVGDTLQLFYSGMIKAKNVYNYDIRVSCSKGAQYGRYFEYKPSVNDSGTIPFNIEVRDNNGNLISTKSCDIIVVNKPVSPGNNINILCIGDSLTTYGQWPEEACRRLIGTINTGTPSADGLTNIRFCGLMHNDLAYYYGHGGWTWNAFTHASGPQFRFFVSGISVEPISGDTYSNNGHTYTVVETNISNGEGNILFSTGSQNNTPSTAPSQLTKITGNGDTTISYSSFANEAENPLWDETNNKMSFVPYVNECCGQNEDVAAVYVLLTWNGLRPYQTDFTTMKVDMKIFADTLHSEYPTAKLKIMSVPMPVPYDSHAYGAGGNLETYSYSDTYALKITAMNMAKMYQEFANSDELSGTSGDAYNTFVEYVGVPIQYDCEYSVQLSKKIANTRIRIIDYVPRTRYELGTFIKYQNQYYLVTSIIPDSFPSFEYAIERNNVQLFDPYETITGNTVHPAETGYMQIADAVYRNIVANFCQ